MLSRDIRAGAAYVEIALRDGRLARGLKNAKRKISAFSAGLRSVGMKVSAIAATMAVPFTAATKVYADFEQQMANVSTMVDDTDKHMGNFRKGIREMSSDFGEGTDTLSAGLYDILSASIPAEKALGVLSVSAKAAKAGITDTGTAADAITTILNAYGMSADQAAEVSDKLFSIVKRGKTTFDRLAPTIGNIATLASTAGVSIDELGAGIALLTRNGIKTEEAVTALSAIISTFLKPSAEGAKIAKELGFSLNTATLQAEGMEGVFKRISGLPPDALSKIFPNTRAIKGVLPALKNLVGFTEDIEALRNGAGSTDAAFEKMSNTLLSAFQETKQAALGALSVIGEAIAKPVRSGTQAIKKYLTVLRDWASENPGIIRALFVLTTATGAAGVAITALGVAGAGLSLVLGGLATILTIVGSGLAFIIKMFALLVSPLGLTVSLFTALGGVILYATGAGGAALKWLAGRFEELKQVGVSSWSAIARALAEGDINKAAKILWLALKMEWQRGAHALTEIWLALKHTYWQFMSDLAYGGIEIFVRSNAVLEKGWLHTVHFMMDAWLLLNDYMMKTWANTQGWIHKRLIDLWGLFDSNLNTTVLKGFVDLSTRNRVNDIDRGTLNAVNDRTNERNDQISTINKQKSDALSDINRAALDDRRSRDEKHSRELAASSKALADARKEWESSLESNQPESQEGGESESPSFGSVRSVFDEITKEIQERVSGLSTTAANALNSRSTFNASRAQGLSSSGSTEERIAKATEESARHLKRVERVVREGDGPVFA